MRLLLVLRALWLRGGIAWVVACSLSGLAEATAGAAVSVALGDEGSTPSARDAETESSACPRLRRWPGRTPDSPAHLMYLKNKGDGFVRAILESMLRVDTRKGGRSAAISHVRQLINHATDQRTALKDVERKLERGREALESREQELRRHLDALASAKKRRRAVDVWSPGPSQEHVHRVAGGSDRRRASALGARLPEFLLRCSSL